MAGSDKLAVAGLEIQGSGVASSNYIASMLEDAHMLKDLEWGQIEALANYIQLYKAAPGTVLFNEGDKGDFMCIVLEGKLEVRKEDNQGVSKTVSVVSMGRSLGEMTMVDGEPRSASAVAVDESMLAVLTQENFKLIMQDRPALAVKLLYKIAQSISQRLRQTSGMLVDYLES